MGFFNQFLQGRYGIDKLSVRLIWVGVGMSVLSWFLGGLLQVQGVLRILSMAFYAYAAFRILSRNFLARQAELAAYLRFENRLRNLWQRVRYGHRNVINLNAERKKYKYLICPQCRQKLRVPRGKNKIRVTCTKCGCKFDAKS